MTALQLKIPKIPKPIKKGRGHGGRKGPGASWEISTLIKQAWFLSPSAGIMCLAHYSPDYCLSTAITGKTSVNTFINDSAPLMANVTFSV